MNTKIMKQTDIRKQEKIYRKIEKIVNLAFNRSKNNSNKKIKTTTSLLFQ